MSRLESLQNEIRKALLDSGGLSQVSTDILSRCTALVSTVQVTPNQLADCWAAFSLNKNLQSLDKHSFDSFRSHVIKEYNAKGGVAMSGAVMTTDRKRQSNTVVANVTPPSKKAGKSNNDTTHSDISNTNRRVSVSPPESTRPKYSDRKDRGKVIDSFNPNNLQQTMSEWAVNSPRCKVSYLEFETNQNTPYRHFFTTIDDRSKALNDHLEDLKAAMVDRYRLDLEAVGIPRPSKICCVGRICNASHEGRLNSTSIMLEGSRSESGTRVELDVSDLISNPATSYSLFPGQIVTVEGTNASGRKLVAERISEGVAHHPHKSSVKELLKFHHDDSFQGGAPLRFMTAAGPFTTSDNLDYKPLVDFIVRVRLQKPDIVFLLGPFVDTRQNVIGEGETKLQYDDGAEITVPFETFFANKISWLLEELYDKERDCSTQFVLVPSLHDATAEFVFPQSPFALNEKGYKCEMLGGEGITCGTLGLQNVNEKVGRIDFQRIHCVPNPCTIKVNELTIGITSTDILFDMNPNETNANLQPGSRLARMAQHLLQQRSYYPLFPGAANSNLNLKKRKQWSIPCDLDILIVPSKLKPFSRTVMDHTVVVNCGHLCQDTTAGSYAIVDVYPIQREVLERAGGDDVELLHNVQDRITVDIRKI